VLDISWERIASDFDILHGGLMLFGVLVMLFAPIAMARLCDEI